MRKTGAGFCAGFSAGKEFFMKKVLLCALSLLLAASTLFGCDTKKEKKDENTTEAVTTEAVTTKEPTDYSKQITIKTEDAVKNDLIKVNGRYEFLKNGALSCDHTGCGIEFSLDCEGTVAVNVTTTGDIYFTVWVDGVRQDKENREGYAVSGIAVTAKKRSVPMILGENLPAGEHNFKIAKQTNPRTSVASIDSVSFSGKFLDRPADKPVLIEFIGDSLTAGSVNIGDKNIKLSASSAVYEDGTQSYAYLAAEKLGVDVSVVARPGIGLLYGTGGDSSTQMGAIYHLQSWWRSTKTEYVPVRTPDLVVINLGTNDQGSMSSAGGSIAAYTKGLTDFIGVIRGYYGEVPIMILVNNDIAGSFRPATVEATKGMNGITIESYQRHKNGGNNHPNLSECRIEADTLVSQLKNHYPELFNK